ncbi:CDP-alcohol phosphatidyltransferase family protein, partial [Polaromonas sp.]|uniref:CDP-alcohol phosphatidyltransferase family protein n=1 Tax=Polaromonas sp. TaxID=1869339 RepID=UPI002B805F37
MLDRYATALIRPALQRLADPLARAGVTANQLTLAGFLIGLLAAILIAAHAYFVALAAILVSRACDALDGAVAR